MGSIKRLKPHPRTRLRPGLDRGRGLFTSAESYEKRIMKISAIKIDPSSANDTQFLAAAEVVLNDSLTLRGIRILRGRYGLFLAFPGLRSGSPQRAFDTLSMRFRKELQTAVLAAYRDSETAPLSLFADCTA
jgi:DNA-binding cell septation regulator SpoVG